MKKDWIDCNIDDVIVLMKNGSSAKQFKENVGLPITRIETIWNETIDLDRVKYIKDYDSELLNKHSLKRGDILLSHINSDNHLGKSALFNNQVETLIHGINLLLLRPNQMVVPAFLNYQLKFFKYKGKFIDAAQRAVNQSSINQRKLKRFEIELPPLPIQRAIVSKIEQLFSELDNGIQNLQQAKEKIEVFRQSVLKKAFEGELTKEWRRENNVSKESSWSNNIFSDVLIRSKEKFKPDSKEKAFYIGLEHIEKNKGSLSRDCGIAEISTTKNVFKPGQILYGKLRPYLNKVYLTDKEGVCSTDILVFDAIEEKVNTKYMIHLMLGKTFVNDMSENTSGVNLPRVSTKYINEYKLTLPTIIEQEQIVEEIESRLSVCDELEKSIDSSLEKAEALRQSILKKAFSGELLTEKEIEACKEASDWESAEELLKRIEEDNKKTKKSTKK